MGIWRSEHQKVLRAAVKLFDDDGHGPIMADRLASETGLDETRVSAAINALNQANPPYFVGVEGNLNHLTGIKAPTTARRQAIGWRAPGAWPDSARRALVVSVVSLSISLLSLIFSLR